MEFLFINDPFGEDRSVIIVEGIFQNASIFIILFYKRRKEIFVKAPVLDKINIFNELQLFRKKIARVHIDSTRAIIWSLAFAIKCGLISVVLR